MESLRSTQGEEREAPRILLELLGDAGISINGDAPWDFIVHDSDVWQEILTHGSVGLGEAYMDGLWDSPRLDEFFTRLLRIDADERVKGWSRLRLIGEALRHRFINRQSVSRAFQVGEQHYDLGNDVFAAMLDPTMAYSCGYWAAADNLNDAQLAKYDLICRKLQLKPGERVLEIGCGWGGLAHYAAKHYGVHMLGITVSKEQQALALERCAGLPVEIELIDYRSLEGSFDKVVSVGMFEHVGPKNYATYFSTAHRLLKDDGLFLLHSIGNYAASNGTDAWIDKYIFPNGHLPSMREISASVENLFLVEDWHNFGTDYDRTLMAWWHNFNHAWPQLEAKYGQRFHRMWKYYLMCCAGFFRSRQGQLWQIVLSKRERTSVYRSVR
ncbi:MAG TPA: cyclopropane fatty acyl phospholipid synthase [Rhodocyclaceae bacterium]|jgi:cyclopropane-fatty-acyl-phospholipid synthase|nr:cyclopropane fatty acyl phospholipid synthase [Rhodocyclaceae bacterium]